VRSRARLHGPRDGLLAGGRAASFARIATRIHAHRSALIATGLGAFLLASLPLFGVALAGWPLSPWHVASFASGIPVVLWAFCLALIGTYFHPAHGLVAPPERPLPGRQPWQHRAQLAYATLTVVAFALAPLVVLFAAAT
jgi:hypothetical protein